MPPSHKPLREVWHWSLEYTSASYSKPETFGQLGNSLLRNLQPKIPNPKWAPTLYPQRVCGVGLCCNLKPHAATLDMGASHDEGPKGPQRVLCDYTGPTRFPKGFFRDNVEKSQMPGSCIRLKAVWGAYIRWLGDKLPK